MGFGLIIIGDEILSGKRQDKHLEKVIAILKQRGLQLDWAEYVGDKRERITATFNAVLPVTTSCFPPAASAQRRTTIPVSAQLPH
jgi:molybdopterin-biosynthesis enzyme MoeA-like protein